MCGKASVRMWFWNRISGRNTMGRSISVSSIRWRRWILLGNVFDGIQKQELVNEFKGCNVYTKEKCKDCFARFYCSGGCAANSYKFHGTLNDAYDIGCEMERKRVECALMIKAALAE